MHVLYVFYRDALSQHNINNLCTYFTSFMEMPDLCKSNCICHNEICLSRVTLYKNACWKLKCSMSIENCATVDLNTVHCLSHWVGKQKEDWIWGEYSSYPNTSVHLQWIPLGRVHTLHPRLGPEHRNNPLLHSKILHYSHPHHSHRKVPSKLYMYG